MFFHLITFQSVIEPTTTTIFPFLVSVINPYSHKKYFRSASLNSDLFKLYCKVWWEVSGQNRRQSLSIYFEIKVQWKDIIKVCVDNSLSTPCLNIILCIDNWFSLPIADALLLKI